MRRDWPLEVYDQVPDIELGRHVTLQNLPLVQVRSSDLDATVPMKMASNHLPTSSLALCTYTLGEASELYRWWS